MMAAMTDGRLMGDMGAAVSVLWLRNAANTGSRA
jgi:hypothetical protein